jgi:hypothetical protein
MCTHATIALLGNQCAMVGDNKGHPLTINTQQLTNYSIDVFLKVTDFLVDLPTVAFLCICIMRN